nr:FBP domain-containing protein [Gordonia sp. UBA5067]
MQELSSAMIRSAFRGATRSEVARVTYPDLGSINFAGLDFLGWRDPKIPRRAYLVVEQTDGVVALLLTRATATPRGRAMCSWCTDVNLTEAAVLYTVRRAGAAGRRGSTLGILICERFGCSRHARQLPPAYHRGTDLDAVRADRVAALRRRIRTFVDEVLADND